jgi:hypothetical protein
LFRTAQLFTGFLFTQAPLFELGDSVGHGRDVFPVGTPQQLSRFAVQAEHL